MNQTAIDTGLGVAECARAEPFDAAVGNFAHELANPLNAIAITTELARRMLARGQNSRAAEALEKVNADCERCGRLLRDAQDYFSIKSNPASGDELELKSLLDQSSLELAGRGEIAWCGSPCRDSVRGNSRSLCRMFGELLSNAFDHGARRVELSVESASSEWCVRITDDGPGIESILMPRIFEPFFSTSRQQHSGIGLSIARAIAQAHGGEVGAENTDHGAAFWVRLPARH